MRAKPWEGFAMRSDSYLVAETLVDDFAPDPIDNGEITRYFVRHCRRSPLDDEFVEITAHLLNFGLEIRDTTA